MVDVNCTITKVGNNSGMCTFYYCACLANILAAMFCRMYLDNVVETSQTCCSLEYMLVVSVGFDKSNTDFVDT